MESKISSLILDALEEIKKQQNFRLISLSRSSLWVSL